jgi:hypothetical protein
MKKRKVRITKLPEMKQGGAPRMFGNQTPPVDNTSIPGKGSYHGGNDPEIKVNRTLKPTSKENATLEAELGETVITNLQGEGIPEFYNIGGKPHSKGGTPLNLPANSFIFSKDKSLHIKDEDVLKMFGKTPKKKGYSPAELSKSFDLNKYREILIDPNADKKSKETAEMMIKNYNLKLGSLALVQESMKGFEDGIPAVALPYLDHMQINPTDLLGPQNAPGQGLQQFKGGGSYVPKYQMAGQFDPASPEVQEEQEAFWNLFNIKSKQKNNIGQLGKRLLGPTMDAVTAMKNASDPSAERAINMATRLENIADVQGSDRGTNTFNPVGVIRPDAMTPIQFYGNEVAKMGGTKGKRKVRVTMPKYNNGGNTDPRKKYYDIPEDANVWSAEKYAQDPSIAKAGDYVMVDGVPKLIKSRKTGAYDDEYKTDLLTNQQFKDSYGLMQSKILGNDEFKDAIVKNFQENLKNLKPGKNLTRADIVAMQEMKADDIVKNFLDYELRNYRVSEKVGTLGDKDYDSTKGQQNIKQTLRDLGYSEDEINNTANTAAFQNVFKSLVDLEKSGEFKETFRDLGIAGLGKADEAGDYANISSIDGVYGDTTAGQVLKANQTEDVYEDVKELIDEEQKIKGLGDKQRTPVPPAKAWLQDQVNLAGALGDQLSLKKYDPWQAPYIGTYATPTFTSFEGAAARNLAAQRGALDVAGTYGGPQSLMSRATKMADPKTVLALQEQENRANVAIDNQFKMQNATMRNRNNMMKANLATSLYDKQIASNEAFDNAKRAMKWNTINMANNLITNKWKTDTMNQMYPQYAINPAVGGQLYFDPSQATDVQATKQGTDIADRFATLKGRFPDATADEMKLLLEGYNASSLPQKDERAYIPQYPGVVGPNSYPTS